jgi:hypothetical protein
MSHRNLHHASPESMHSAYRKDILLYKKRKLGDTFFKFILYGMWSNLFYIFQFYLTLLVKICMYALEPAIRTFVRATPLCSVPWVETKLSFMYIFVTVSIMRKFTTCFGRKHIVTVHPHQQPLTSAFSRAPVGNSPTIC